MKITVDQSFQIQNAINSFQATKLPAKVAYGFTRNKTILSKISADFETSRLELLEKYSNKDEEGKLITINGNADLTPEALAEYNAEISKLLMVEEEVALHMIKLSEFDNIEMPQMTMDMLHHIISE